MNLELVPLDKENLKEFKKDMQYAFQKGAMQEFDATNEGILPEKDIDESLKKKNSVALKAMLDGKMLGGAIVVINKKTGHNHLDFLYVKYGVQDKGIGKCIWKKIEKLYPQTQIWETCTPYFEKRNIHFYINCLGFHAVEFFNSQHRDTSLLENRIGKDYFFCFEKIMR